MDPEEQTQRTDLQKLIYSHMQEKDTQALQWAAYLHDYRDTRPARSNEAQLLREADYLDFLGAIGTACNFGGVQRDLQASLELILARREAVRHRFTLPRARTMAAERLACMQDFFQALEEESFGFI